MRRVQAVRRHEPVFGAGPIERGTAALTALMVDGAPVAEIALAASEFADEFLEVAAKSPTERTLVSKVAGMFETAARVAIKRLKAEGSMEVPDPDTYLSTAEFAALVRRSTSTVQGWRHNGFGPKGFRLRGGGVLYRRAEVEAWLAEAERADFDR